MQRHAPKHEATATQTSTAEHQRSREARRDDTVGAFTASLHASELQLSALDAALLQFRAQVQSRRAPTADPHAVCAAATATPSGALPHLDQIQRSFGHHDVGGVKTHTGPIAEQSAAALGARAFAAADHVVLGRDGGDLHTAAHEAAHVIQQRSGIHLAGGVGRVGDVYERHADAVADRVVQGRSAVDLLDSVPSLGGGGGGLESLQFKEASDSKREEERGIATSLPGVLEDNLSGIAQASVLGDRWVVAFVGADLRATKATPSEVNLAALVVVCRRVLDDDSISGEQVAAAARGVVVFGSADGGGEVETVQKGVLREAVSEIRQELGADLSEEGEDDARAMRYFDFVEQSLVYVRASFARLVNAMDSDDLEEAGVSTLRVQRWLDDPAMRRQLAGVIVYGDEDDVLRELFEGHLSSSEQTRVADLDSVDLMVFGELDDGDWGDLLTEAAVFLNGVIEVNTEEALKETLADDLEEREIEVTDPIAHLLSSYNPGASITLNIGGDIEVKAGDIVKGSGGQDLLVLDAIDYAVHYAKGDTFYWQSKSGFEQNMFGGVDSSIAEYTKGMSTLAYGVIEWMGIAFKYLGYALDVAHIFIAASRLNEYWPDVEKSWAKITATYAFYEEKLPGFMFDVAIAAISEAFANATLGLKGEPDYTSWFESSAKLFALGAKGAKAKAAFEAGEKVALNFVKLWLFSRGVADVIKSMNIIDLGVDVDFGPYVDELASKLIHEGLPNAEYWAEEIFWLDEEAIDRFPTQTAFGLDGAERMAEIMNSVASGGWDFDLAK